MKKAEEKPHSAGQGMQLHSSEWELCVQRDRRFTSMSQSPHFSCSPVKQHRGLFAGNHGCFKEQLRKIHGVRYVSLEVVWGSADDHPP